MKWFGDIKVASEPIELARQSIEYLKAAGEKPEKWRVWRDLRLLIKKNLLPAEILVEIVNLRWKQLYVPIASNASTEIIDEIMKMKIRDQHLYAVLIYNKNLSKIHAQSILEMCDESQRGEANLSAIKRKFGLSNPIGNTTENI